MKRFFLFTVLFLTGCGVTVPPRDNAQWTTSVRGVQITWRWTNPGELGRGTQAQAHTVPGGQACVVDIDPLVSRTNLTHVAAYEAGSCLQARYLLPGLPRPDLGKAFAGGAAGFAETYALAYLAACDISLQPLGWADPVPSTSCTEAPDPRDLRRP